MNTALWIIGSPLPRLEEIYTSRLLRRATRIRNGPAHPGHSLFWQTQSHESPDQQTETQLLAHGCEETAAGTMSFHWCMMETDVMV
ncbi:uncharacterized protein V6R79_000728 [Siganus canaliculatus]